MTTVALKTRVLLLVEDNPGDADLVEGLLEEGPDGYQVLHVASLADAIVKVQATAVDVVVLDLRLPDCSGVDTVKVFHEAVGDLPIVVLTGTEDEQVSLACIEAGAQDYISKNELRPRQLRRAIGYAITRMREKQLRSLQETLDQYRALSSHAQPTTITAALAGSGALSVRSPGAFHKLVSRYHALFDPYLAQETDRIGASRTTLERIITAIGDAGGGPRDLLDVHVAALDLALAQHESAHARSVVFEARLLALEMMGLLVDYYRVGLRRHSTEGFES